MDGGRRVGLWAIALVVATALVPSQGAAATTAAQPVGGESTAFQANAAHDGHVVDPGLNPPLVKKWSKDLGGAVSYPVVAAGKVFVISAAGSANGGGSYGTYIWAFEAASGAVAWGPVPLGGTYWWSGLTYGGGKLYTLNGDGILRAFDPATGAQQWIIDLPGQYSFSSEPTYYGGIVYAGGAGSGGTVYAVAADTGELLWTASVANGDHSSPAVSDDGVYVSYACPNTYAFDPQTGEELWAYHPGCSGGGGTNTVLAHGLLWTRDFGGNHVYNATTGAIALVHASVTAPAFDETRGYFKEGNTLFARVPETQLPLWSFSGDGNLSSSPLVVNDTVYIGSTSGMLYALDAATGAVVWKGNVGAPILPPDEHNVSSPVTGLGAGQGVVVVPASNLVVAYGTAPDPVGFGWNGYGTVGDGSTATRMAASPLTSIDKQADISAGEYHSLGVAFDGTVRAWGWNGYGQLGDGTTTTRTAPTVVPGLSNVTAVAAGAYHSLALRADGTVWGWGFNAVGQLGDGSTTNRSSPVQVVGLTDVVAIAAGQYHSLALRADGTVVAWGWNGLGQLGDGSTTQRLVAVPVSGLNNVAAIGAGAYHSLAVLQGGQVFGWGWNGLGQLGDGTTTQRELPQQMILNQLARSVAGGTYHSLVLLRNGTVLATGWNGFGNLGDGTVTGRTSPVAVQGLTGVVDIDAGFIHNLAVTANGTVYGWGWGGLGGLGDGTGNESHTPVEATNLAGANLVAAGFAFSLAS